jgi:hypothetical protein
VGQRRNNLGLYPSPRLSTETRRRRAFLAGGTIAILAAQISACIIYRTTGLPPTLGVLKSYVWPVLPAALFAAGVFAIAMPFRAEVASRFEKAMPWVLRLTGFGPLAYVICKFLADRVVPCFDAPLYDKFALAAAIAGQVATLLLFDQIACLAARVPAWTIAGFAKVACYLSGTFGVLMFLAPVIEGNAILQLLSLTVPAFMCGFAIAVLKDTPGRRV